MKSITKLSILLIFLIASVYFISVNDSNASAKGDCDVYIYVANNSMFDVNIFIENVGVGRVLMSGNKTFTFNLATATAKRLKIRAEYSDPDFIDPRSINYVTHQKIDCGMSDSIYVLFAK